MDTGQSYLTAGYGYGGLADIEQVDAICFNLRTGGAELPPQRSYIHL